VDEYSPTKAAWLLLKLCCTLLTVFDILPASSNFPANEYYIILALAKLHNCSHLQWAAGKGDWWCHPDVPRRFSNQPSTKSCPKENRKPNTGLWNPR